MKILLLGSSGMLGSDCKNVLEKEHEIIAPTRKELDIVSWDKVIEGLQNIDPDVVVNCAAFADVDGCEIKDGFKMIKVNVEGPRNLAQGAARFNCKLVHISSDYVYNGLKSIPQPYFEDDPSDPLSEYGKMKMHSETTVRENAPDYIIIRSGWLYGLNGNHFISSILANALNPKKKSFKVIEDQYGSPTWTYRLALQMNELIKKDAKGTFHATAEGFCSRFEFAGYVIKKLKIKTKIEPCKMKDYKQKARRPKNCILENRLLKKHGWNIMPQWHEDLDAFLLEHGAELVRQAKLKKKK